MAASRTRVDDRRHADAADDDDGSYKTMLTICHLADDEREPLAPRGAEVGSFSALRGRHDRHGRVLPAVLVDSVLGIVGEGSQPTPIQAECWSRLLAPSAPDIVAISPTGSGKTLAFLLPVLAEVMSQPPTVPPARPEPDGSRPRPGDQIYLAY